MNAVFNILRTGYIISMFLLISCETENITINNYDCGCKDNASKKTGFYIEISDGTIIGECDILYYDSSTCILFLKDSLFISYQEPETGTTLKAEFTVFVNRDTIYKGIIYPRDYHMSAMPPQKLFIIYRDAFDSNRSVLEIGTAYHSKDFRNDPRIINALKNSGLLRSGISFTIDSITAFNYYIRDSVECVVTVHNLDTANYYILDPQKMGERYYNWYNRGLVFSRHESSYVAYYDGIVQPEYGTITKEDFSLLEGNGSLTFRFGSNDYFISFNGIYKCSFCLRYRNSNITLNQPNGRIWIGSVCSSIDNIVINYNNN